MSYKIRTKNKVLNKDINVDILVIGAGITGMMSAYYLDSDKSICVVDKNKLGKGVTLNTTAKINYFQQTIYTDIEKLTNKEMATNYFNLVRDGIDEFKKVINKEKIDCDFERVPSYVFASKDSDISKLDKEITFLRKNGIIVSERKLPLDIKSYKSYYVEDTYIFNPLKFLQGIYNVLEKRGVNVYEDSKIVKIEKHNNYYLCYGTNFRIRAKVVVLGCHYPFYLSGLLLPLKSYIEKSYIIVSKVKKDKGFTAISVSKPMYSVRYYKDKNSIYQISLSNSHNTAIKQNDVDNFRKVQDRFNIKDKDIVCKYSNMDIMTTDNMPYIGCIDNNLYIGVGYNTWGMTNGIMAGRIIADMILNKKNKYSEVFSPKRINGSNLIVGVMVVGSALKSFVGTKLNKNKSWYSKRVTFKNINGKSIGIYVDENNNKHIVYNKCPHMGCSLIFNEVELTWDCPCHSSRFDLNGKCIKGPSNYDITYKD